VPALTTRSRVRAAAVARRSARRLFVLRRSSLHGRGAFALVPIPKGTRVIEYLGERISHAEADARYDDDAMTNHHTFLMIVNRKWVIDAAFGGNEARFINHSCEPNCEIVIDRGRAFIDAIRHIYPGEEITYDYAYEREDGDDEHALTRYPCRCGAPGCRRTILAPLD